MTSSSEKNSTFSKALDLVESPEPVQRINGLLLLESLGDEKSCRVIQKLAKDPSAGVSFQAERILKKFCIQGSYEEKKESLPETMIIRSGFEILRETISLCRRHFASICALYWLLAGIKTIIILVLAQYSEAFDKDFYSAWRAIPVLISVNALTLPMIWRFWGVRTANRLPTYLNRDRNIFRPGIGSYTSLLRSELLSQMPLLVLLLLFVPKPLNLIMFVVFLPVALKFTYLTLPLMPLKIMQLKLWQSPFESCLRLFMRSGNLITEFYRPGLFFYALGQVIISLLLIGAFKAVTGEILPGSIFFCLLISELVVAPVWLSYRLIFALLFFCENHFDEKESVIS